MRYRERINTESENHYDHTFCCKESITSLAEKCPGSVLNEFNYVSSRSYEAMEDVVTPNFKKESALGHIVNSPMLSENLEYRQTALTFVEDWAHPPNTYETGYGFAFSRLPFTPLLLSPVRVAELDALFRPFASERDLCVTQAWANVDESEMLALASLGELPETVAWLASLYKRAATLFKRFKDKRNGIERKKRKMTNKQYLDSRSNFWLELRYAVRPLIFEAAQIAAILEGLTGGQQRNTARGFYESSSDDTSSPFSVGMTPDRSASCVETVQRTSNYRAGVLYTYDLSKAGWANTLGLDKPIESLWELTKLSFMLDWFFNLGDVISSFTPSAQLSPLTSWITEEHTFTTECVYSDYQVEDGIEWTHLGVTTENAGYERLVRKIKRRTISPSRSPFPHISINLDWAKCLDLAAIARTIYRGLKR